MDEKPKNTGAITFAGFWVMCLVIIGVTTYIIVMLAADAHNYNTALAGLALAAAIFGWLSHLYTKRDRR